MGALRAEPSRSKWIMAAVAVAAIGVGLYAFRDTYLAGSVNARLVKVYALLFKARFLPLMKCREAWRAF